MYIGFVLPALAVFLAGFAAVLWKKLGGSSYERLLEEKARLNACVVDWRYPDGSFVPQHKRMRMFRDLHRLSRKIHQHPRNPANRPF